MGKIVKLKNKKTGERVYPVTATKAVVDADSGERLNDTLLNKVEEAPVDGNQYVRINGTWGIAQMATSTKEKCIITLASNQGESDAASLYGATVKVTDVDSAEVYYDGVWDGTEIALEFAPGVNYKVEVGAVADYATPESKTLTALEFNVRNLVFTYNTELVSVMLSSNNGTSVAGQIVTINGVQKTFDGTNAVTQKVAFGVEYTISFEGKSGYLSPTKQTLTASKVVNNIVAEYKEVPTGIYIQSVDGSLYLKDDWNTSFDLNGVAVVTDNCRFVIAPYYAYSKSLMWEPGGNVGLVDGVTVAETLEDAILDFNGVGNTQAMISGIAEQEPKDPARYCEEYIFPNGKNGYLGAAGEWNAVLENKDEIKDILEFLGMPLIEVNCWTSTQAGNFSAWKYYYYMGKMSTHSTNSLSQDSADNCFVRAFMEF